MGRLVLPDIQVAEGVSIFGTGGLRLVSSFRRQAPRWSLEVPAAHRDGHLRAKRAFDVAVAAFLLVLLSPLLLLIAVLVRMTSRGPALFVQPRIGRGCRIFSMYKFRTMRQGADRQQDLLARARPGRTFLKIAGDPRVTAVGRLLRRFSLDELPQLYNVLKGDMSLVGPRPLLPCDFRKFPKHEQLRRFVAVPGLTGLWQVSGRSTTTDTQRIRLDLDYVDRWSLWLDIGILARTLPVVVSGRGAE